MVDASGLSVVPGFVDLHAHGGDGHDAMDATPSAIAGMARHLARHGVTGFLPTTLSAPRPDLLRAVRNVAEAIADPPLGARPLGVHLEGPFLNPDKKGAHRAEHLRPPDLAELEAYLSAGPVRLLTLAPELPGVEALIRHAVACGVTVGLGHTAASYEEACAAIDWGVTHAAHTFNAMSGLHHREPGAVGAVLTRAKLRAELIADFVHTHPALVKLLVQAKGVERTILVSDAIRAAGLADGIYELGGQRIIVADRVCKLSTGTLAGSTLTLDRALRNAMGATGLSLAEALPMVTRAPAAAIGMGDEIGALSPGYRADVVLLDAAHQVVMTWVGGQMVYRRDA